LNCEREGDSWVLQTSDANKTIVAVTALLRSEGNELVDLQIRRASLEDLFVELTGE
jgi:hypothetical protein